MVARSYSPQPFERYSGEGICDRPGRMTEMMRRGPTATAVALTVFAVACGGPEAQIPVPQLEADRILFERGTDAMEEENWAIAREYFIQIRDNYPQSSFRADARLFIGDTYEGEGSAESYGQPLNEFSDFLNLYPTHPRAAYAQFKVGMVHFHQMRTPERDQTETISAIREFEAFIAQYPPAHELMPQVEERAREAKDRLGEHHFLVGQFYNRFESWAGAISRFREVLDNAPDFSSRDDVFSSSPMRSPQRARRPRPFPTSPGSSTSSPRASTRNRRERNSPN